MEELEQRLKPLMLMGLAGDGAAQRQLLQLCADRLRDYYRKRLPDREFDVEDLVQESLIAVHQRRASYDTQRPFTAWLHAIARYKLADLLRLQYRRRSVPLSGAADLIDSEFDAPELGVTCDVERLLDGLPKPQRELVDGSIFREWIANVGRRDARTRIAHLLCEFSLRLKVAGIGEDSSYELPMTQEQMGDATGLTPVHVNRTMKGLEADGLIERPGLRSIRIDDWRKLADAGDFDSNYLHLRGDDPALAAMTA